ncbi:MFS transporter [Actinomadura macra]|uniref:MFS transporter n=1 Tax=Actinomadura macra TaxID=46164 RepID=UPI000833071D|nr:MFS transporter [Actinomadura macra]
MDRTTAYQRRWTILAVLCLSLILIGLDTLILNLALPSIQRDLDATTSQLQWTVDAYALAFGGLLLMAGGLADRFGRKRLLALGVSAFALFSLGAALSTSAEAMITFRTLMGVGAALMMPATLAIIKDIFPVEEQAKAIGIWSGAAAVGVPLGPVVSGLLLEKFWWGSLFLINVPLAAVALIAGAALIPESRDPNHPGLDLIGALLSVAGLTAVVYGLVEAPHYGWASPLSLGSLGLGLLLLILFIVHERRTAHPMLDVGMLRNARYGGSTLIITCVSFGLYSGLFLLTLHLQAVLDLSPLAAGVRMLAIGTMMIGAPLSPKLVERAGLRAVVTSGLLLCAAGLGFLAALDVGSDGRALMGLAVFGLGMGIALPAAVDALLVVSAEHQAGAGSAVADTAMQVGGSLGIAVSGSVSVSVYRDELPDLGALPPAAADAVRESVAGASGLAGQLPEQVVLGAKEAFTHGFSWAALIAVGTTLVGAAFSAVVLPRSRTEESSAGSLHGEQARTGA